MNSVSTIKSFEPAKQVDKYRPMIFSVQKNAETAETTALRLNKLAKERPFCCYQKARKHDPF